MFSISLARISLLTGTSLGGGVGVSPTLDLNFRGQGYSAAMAGYTFNQLIDFTRTSAATYVDATGKIVPTPASRNLLTYTQEFDNAAWAKYNLASVTANTSVAPDGTTTADTLTDTTTNSFHVVEQGTSGAASVAGVHTFSAFIKAGTLGFGCVSLLTDSQVKGYGVVIDLSTGSVTSTLSVGTPVSPSYTVTNVGSGWYRISITLTHAAGTVLGYAATSNSGTPASNFALPTYAGSGGTMLVWGAQLERASSATDYTRNNGGVYPPRFDYDPVTLAPKGLLVEEQRTNLLLRSAEFDNAAWVKASNGTGTLPVVTANAAVAPDGTTTADLVAFDRGAGNAIIDQSALSNSAAVTVSSAYTGSIYIKAATAGDVGKQIGFRGVAGVGYQVITLTANWVRIERTETAGTTSGNFELVSRGTITTSNQVSVHVWGAQLEAGSFATSYIPTVASQVTRTEDIAFITGANFSQFYNQSEGTWVVELQKLSPSSAAGRGIELAGASSNFSLRLRLGTDARMQSVDGGAVVVDAQLAASVPATTSKYAMAYKLNDYAGSANGAAAVTDTSATVPALSALRIGGDNVLNLYIRSVRFYPTRLSNSQLQALTA